MFCHICVFLKSRPYIFSLNPRTSVCCHIFATPATHSNDTLTKQVHQRLHTALSMQAFIVQVESPFFPRYTDDSLERKVKDAEANVIASTKSVSCGGVSTQRLRIPLNTCYLFPNSLDGKAACSGLYWSYF